MTGAVFMAAMFPATAPSRNQALKRGASTTRMYSIEQYGGGLSYIAQTKQKESLNIVINKVLLRLFGIFRVVILSEEEVPQ
jgi:hypothetical protein